MKKIKICLSVFLSLVLCFSMTAFASASGEESGSFKALCYNVAGLPDFAGIVTGNQKDVASAQSQLGTFLNSSDYDFIAVQEDFGYHYSLVQPLTNYPYRTIYTGPVPGGDGLNVFSRKPVYNEKRMPWEKAYGLIDDGADELTPKGFLYCVVEIADGVYIDLYNMHADAYGDEGSTEARDDNFRQLFEYIESHDNGRAVIITGDFNISSHHSTGGYLTECILSGGYKDAYTELHNGGDYYDYSSHYSEGMDWGVWDSVEKFVYKNGDNLTLDCTDFSYRWIYDKDGVSISDHAAASVSFNYTVTSAEDGSGLKEPAVTKLTIRAFFQNIIDTILKDLRLIFSNFGRAVEELKTLIGQQQ